MSPKAISVLNSTPLLRAWSPAASVTPLASGSISCQRRDRVIYTLLHVGRDVV